MFVEINLRKNKWLLSCYYNPQKSEIRKHFRAIGKNLNLYSSKYENANVEPTEDATEEFMKVYNLKNLVKGSTCLKNPDKPSCINLILTNKSKNFQTSQIIETDISDFHEMVMTVLKVYFKKKQPSVIQYHNYKNFNKILIKMIIIFLIKNLEMIYLLNCLDLKLKPQALTFLLIQC